MSFPFSQASLDKLSTCDERLQKVMHRVAETWNCTILFGHRGQEDQNEAVAKKRSSLKWPNSKHNSFPSRAVDVAPYPVVWPDQQADPTSRAEGYMRYHYFAGFVVATAASMGIKLRWGGDWDSDLHPFEKGENDLVHFELVD